MIIAPLIVSDGLWLTSLVFLCCETQMEPMRGNASGSCIGIIIGIEFRRSVKSLRCDDGWLERCYVNLLLSVSCCWLALRFEIRDQRDALLPILRNFLL